MPAFANIVTSDWGALGATPVTHTLVPNRIDAQGVAHYVEAGATSLGDLKATVSLRRTADNGKIKFNLRIAQPVVANETINGVVSPKLLRTAYADLTFTADSSSSAQERGDILRLLGNAIDTLDTQTFTVWKDNLGVY